MASIIKWLDDPYLVVKFQRFFGVLPNEKCEHVTKNGDAHAGSTGQVLSNGQHTPAVVNDYEITKLTSKNGVLYQNGCTPTDLGDGVTKRNVSKQQEDPSNNNCKSLEKEGTKSNTKTSRSVAWDIVSNQERGIEDKWETDEYVIKNRLLYYIFNFGANLGNEIFYITFFPFWLWNIDSFVGRRVCIFWALFMYLGQVTKDLLKIPRPASPPVIRLEKLYALEYGMPSTHAMVGAGFPFSILLLTSERYVFPFEYGLAIAVLWTTIVCCSRLYLGMHSLLDLIGGLLYVFTLMPIWLALKDQMDDFVLQNPYSPIISLSVPLLLCIFYPKYERWSPARGDTFIILAVLAGICFGSWFNYQFGYIQRAHGSAPYEIIYPDFLNLGLMILRTLVGVIVLFLTRAITKFVGYNIFCNLFGLDKNDPHTKQELCMEIACKYVTYSAVAFNAVVLAPLIFRFLDIERDSSFTEA